MGYTSSYNFFSSLFDSISIELEFNQILFEPCIPNLGDRGVRFQRQNESERRKIILSKKESLLLFYHTHIHTKSVVKKESLTRVKQ